MLEESTRHDDTGVLVPWESNDSSNNRACKVSIEATTVEVSRILSFWTPRAARSNGIRQATIKRNPACWRYNRVEARCRRSWRVCCKLFKANNRSFFKRMKKLDLDVNEASLRHYSPEAHVLTNELFRINLGATFQGRQDFLTFTLKLGNGRRSPTKIGSSTQKARKTKCNDSTLEQRRSLSSG